MSLIATRYRLSLSAATMVAFALTTVTMFGLLSSSPAYARGGGGGGFSRGGGGGGGFSRGGAGGGLSRPSGAGGGMSMSRPNVSSGTYNRGSVNSANVNRSNVNTANVNRGNVNTGNINRGNVNTGNINTGNINVNTGNDWDDNWGAFAAGAVVGGVTGAAVASPGYYPPPAYAAPSTTYVYSLPPSCTPVVVNGTTYQNCGGTYYAPVYQGTSLAYEAVPAP